MKDYTLLIYFRNEPDLQKLNESFKKIGEETKSMISYYPGVIEYKNKCWDGILDLQSEQDPEEICHELLKEDVKLTDQIDTILCENIDFGLITYQKF